MKTKSMATHCLEIFALLMIGEGIVALLRPRRYSLFWNIGPQWMREFAKSCAENPKTTRLFCVGEVAIGLWLSLREIEK